MSDTTAQLQQLLDREAIRDLAARYAHLVWQNQPLATVELFTEDGVVDLGADGGRIEGQQALRAIYSEKVGSMMLHPFVSLNSMATTPAASPTWIYAVSAMARA